MAVKLTEIVDEALLSRGGHRRIFSISQSHGTVGLSSALGGHVHQFPMRKSTYFPGMSGGAKSAKPIRGFCQRLKENKVGSVVTCQVKESIFQPEPSSRPIQIFVLTR